MTTREYLGQIGELQKQITVNTEKLRILYEASYNTDRYDRKDNRSSITARPMKTNGVIGYDAIELQLKEDKERLIELKSQIMIELAMNLENTQHLEVIKLRYTPSRQDFPL